MDIVEYAMQNSRKRVLVVMEDTHTSVGYHYNLKKRLKLGIKFRSENAKLEELVGCFLEYSERELLKNHKTLFITPRILLNHLIADIRNKAKVKSFLNHFDSIIVSLSNLYNFYFRI